MIEMLIVVVMVAILAAIAYPSYSNYTYRVRRADGKDLAMQIAAAEERFYTSRNVYTDDITGATGLGLSTDLSEKGYYQAAVVLGNAGQTYTASVTPQSIQSADSCGALTINNTGYKDAPSDTGTNGKCW